MQLENQKVMKMLISEVIEWLEKIKAEQGDVNVCVHNTCHDMPCESFLFQMKENEPYIPFCEDRVCTGDYLMIE